MFELGNDAGKGGFDRCNGGVRVILALLFQTASMFQELLPIKIGTVGPGPRFRLRHLGVNPVYEPRTSLSTKNHAPPLLQRHAAAAGLFRDLSCAARRDESAERADRRARGEQRGHDRK